MPEKPVARVGDTGSHGGSIIDGSPSVRGNNRPIALVGSTYNCPVHGPNPIVTGAPYIFGNDVLVAHVGSKTACGAEITSGSPDVFGCVPSLSGEARGIDNSSVKKSYDEQVRVLDRNGNPVAFMPYYIYDEDGNA